MEIKTNMTPETRTQEMQRLIQYGRDAIEYRMLQVLIRSRTLTDADHAEMRSLEALLQNYNDMMGYHEPPANPICAANDADGGQS